MERTRTADRRAAHTVYSAGRTSLLQALAPPGALGRLLASTQAVEAVATLAGVAFGGTLGQTIGLRPTLFVAVAGGLLSPLWLARSPLRALRVLPEHSTPLVGTEASEGCSVVSADTQASAGL